MMTIDRFYFNISELEVTGGGRPGEWSLVFVPVDDAGLYIKIATLDRKTFTALLQRIHDVGTALLTLSAEQSAPRTAEDEPQPEKP